MTNDERFAALLDALRMICDAIPDDADPSDLRWRSALHALLLAFDPNPQSLEQARQQRDLLTAVTRAAWSSDPASPTIRELYPHREQLHIDDPESG